MPFRKNDNVYVLTVWDTGEVTAVPEPERNTVAYDEASGSGDHHDADLRSIPTNERIYKSDYYYVIKARLVGTRRVHETVCIRNGRGRIFTKKSKRSQ